MAHQQPELMNEYGTKFYGKAKTVTGDVWWYEERLSDGTMKKHPLLPVHPQVSVEKIMDSDISKVKS